MFENYAKSLIQFIEMKQLDNQTNGGCYENDYEDTENDAFNEDECEDDDENDDDENFQDECSTLVKNNVLDHYIPNKTVDSFWGKTVSKK